MRIALLRPRQAIPSIASLKAPALRSLTRAERAVRSGSRIAAMQEIKTRKLNVFSSIARPIPLTATTTPERMGPSNRATCRLMLPMAMAAVCCSEGTSLGTTASFAGCPSD